MAKQFLKAFSFIIISILVSSFQVKGQSIERIDISDLFSVKATPFRADESLNKGVLLDLNETLLRRMHKERNFSVQMSLPIDDQENISIHMTEARVLADGFILRTSSGDTLDYEPGIYYRGDIEGYDGFCAITLFENELAGVISIKGKGDYNIGKIENQRSNDYIIFNDRDLNKEIGFECHTPDPDLEGNYTEENHTEARYTDCVKVYIEGDYALNQDKGGVAPATNYITALFNEVAALYDAESIGIEISEIFVWNSQDNYSTDDSGDALDQFESNNPTFNGNLAQLFALGGNGTGGLAWVDVLCGWSPYAYENISSNYNNYPTYSWSVEVVAHEMGHNFGSRHTHACKWNGNNTQIDDCGNEYSNNNGNPIEGDACYDENNPIFPPNAGTVMSYCHLISGVGIDLANGFGTQPGNLIRNRYNSASCLSACNGGVPEIPIADFEADEVEICDGNYIQFYDLSSNNPTSWFWIFEEGDPDESDERDPYIYYEFPGVYDVELEATNAAGSDLLYMPDYITVHPAPVADFTYTIVNNNEVIFENLSQNASGYYWNFGDGNSSNQENPSNVYENDGVYEVTLYNDHSVCEIDFITYSIEIVTPPIAGMIIPIDTGCVPLTFNYNDNSSDNVLNWSWSFEGGTPATSLLKNPSVSYHTPGIYDVSLTVSNSQFSDMISFSDTIRVIDIPSATFIPGISGNTVTFDNTSLMADDYLWDFGDGETSTDSDPVHLYQNGGTYNVELIALNECGSDTLVIPVDISLEASAGFVVDQSTICVSETALFSSTANTTDIDWIFEGGSPASSEELNPTVQYNTAGTFAVTQYAYNDLGGDTLVIEDFITVLPDPTGDFAGTVDAYSVNFMQTLQNATSFQWNFGDGNTSELENPSHEYAADGIYQVSLTVFGTCDTITINKNVIIANPPVATFTMDITSGCAPITVQYTNQSSDNSDTFDWTFEGGNPTTSTETNPVVVYDDPGLFSVMLQAHNEQGQDVMLQDDIIHVLGVPDINFNYSSNLLTFSFDYEGNPDEFISWNFGDGSTSTEINPEHTYAAEGFYDVTLFASNNCGDSQKTYTVEAAIRPVASFTYDVFEGCAPLEVNYTNMTTGNPDSFAWLFEGGTPSTSSEENPSVTYYEGGIFSTQLIAFSDNGNDTLTLEDIIHIEDGPEPDFYFTLDGGTVTFFNNTENADTYIWNFGDGNASIEDEPTHTYTANGDYTVTLYAKNDCGQNSKQITIKITTVGTSETLVETLRLFPNPNKGIFTLQFESLEQHDLEIRIIDFVGKLIERKSHAVHSGANKLFFDLGDLDEGLYLMEVRDRKLIKYIKFSVQ